MIPVWNIGDAHVLHELFVRDDGDLDTGSGVDGDQHLGMTEYVIDVISYQYSWLDHFLFVEMLILVIKNAS